MIEYLYIGFLIGMAAAGAAVYFSNKSDDKEG